MRWIRTLLVPLILLELTIRSSDAFCLTSIGLFSSSCSSSVSSFVSSRSSGIFSSTLERDPGDDGVEGDGVYAGCAVPFMGRLSDLRYLDEGFHFFILLLLGFFLGTNIGFGGAFSSSSSSYS